MFSSVNIFSAENNTLKVGNIKFTGIKTTKPAFLLSKISIKTGSEWNESVKSSVLVQLLNIKAIVEDVKIIEEKKDNNTVDLTIEILEKGSFVFVPYATYSNSKGVMPKAIFRHYNLFGYQKYLNVKVEFLPRDSFNFVFKFRDPAVLNSDNFSYDINSELKFSAINYYANLDANYNVKGVAPLGVLSGDKSKLWNSDNFIRALLGGNFSYRIPDNNIVIIPSVALDYKRIFAKSYRISDSVADNTLERASDLEYFSYRKDENQTEFYLVNNPVDNISPSLGLTFVLPLTALRATIEPGLGLSYTFTLGDENITESTLFNYGKNTYDNFHADARLGFNFNLPYIEAGLSPYIRLHYNKVDSNYNAYSSDPAKNQFKTADYIDLILGLNFTKLYKIKKFTHGLKIGAEYEQRLLGSTAVSRKYITHENGIDINKIKRQSGNTTLSDAPDQTEVSYNVGDVSVTKYKREYVGGGTGVINLFTENYDKYFKFRFDFAYDFDFNFFKAHHFKNRYYIFATYNQVGYFDSYPNISTVNAYSTTVREELSGFAGVICNLKYELPLFYIDTPKFASFRVDRPLKWDIYWDFIVDIGLVGSDSIIEDGEFIYSMWSAPDRHLNIYPVIGVGTALRVLPRFVPLEISLNIFADIYKIYKTKSISGSTIYFSFSIEDKF